MAEQDDLSEYMANMMANYPTTVLLEIFSYLNPAHLTKCRQVCSRWKLIADSLLEKENLWEKGCQSDFADIYKTAYYKRKSELSWSNLYRSLTLWSQLHKTTETHDEVASTVHIKRRNRDFQILRDEEIGVHTTEGIIYYDIKTLKQSNRCIISGAYLRYVENYDTILILGCPSHLYIVRKYRRSTNQEEDTLLPSVKSFLFHNNVIYYVSLNNEILMCDLRDEKIKSNLLVQMSETVLCLGYKNNLHILTFQRNVYSIIGKDLKFQDTLDNAPNLMHMLNKYNFLEDLDWRMYYQWMFQLRHYLPPRSIRDITIVKEYGDIVFLGSESGVFRIYYAPYLNNELDLFNTKPVKEYNFAESDCPHITISTIIQIDVIEGEDSHTVLVAMPKRIAVINYKHNIERNLFNFNEESIEIHASFSKKLLLE